MTNNLPKTNLSSDPQVSGDAASMTKPVAWITGSGSPRVGQVVASYFASRGYRIVVHSHRASQSATDFAELLIKAGSDAMLLDGAVEEPGFAKTAVQQIVQRFGRLDVLVSTAAIWDWKSLEETSAADVQRQFEVNTLGSFLCSQAAGLQMVLQPSGGSIVLIGDWSVIRPYRDFAAYFIGKGAIETMTRSLAVELALRNPSVRVNAIMPGPVLLASTVSPERAQLIEQQCLLKRHGQPEHVAHAAYFFATNDFVTGVCMPVDGGRSIYAGPSTDAIAHATFPQ